MLFVRFIFSFLDLNFIPPPPPPHLLQHLHINSLCRHGPHLCLCLGYASVGLSDMSVTGSNYGYGYIAIRGVLAKVCSCSLTPKLKQLSSLLSLLPPRSSLLTPRLSSAVSTVRCNLSVEQHLAPRAPTPLLPIVCQHNCWHILRLIVRQTRLMSSTPAVLPTHGI